MEKEEKKWINESHVALVGGRVEIGESSEQTIRREIMEEMGKEIEIIEYLSTIENFFDADDMPYHEIMFVYRVDFKGEGEVTAGDIVGDESIEILSLSW